MEEVEPLSVEDAFGDLKDPRSRSPEYALSELLVVAIAAILSGADSWVGIATWGEAKIEWLRQYLTLANGVPSHDTFGRVFAMLDAKHFEACFVRWVGGLCRGLEGKVVAIDGKTVRRSHRLGQGAIHLVSAYCGALRVSLGQVKTEAKSNEITAIPALLEALLLKGAVVTIDAMGCQEGIAQKIVQGGADYVLAVKDNQPSLCEALRELFAAHDARGLKTVRFGEHTEIGKDHGRIETRRCVVSEDIQWLAQRERWCGVRSVAMIESTRQIGEQSSTERRYFISSLRVDAKRLGEAIRAHWGIENSMHWVLDVAFGEDQCRARVKNAAQNFAILRRIVINLLRADPSTKVGAKTKRLKASADDRYRAHILGLVALQ
jgi:predicted transposase YbfD/YdcC